VGKRSYDQHCTVARALDVVGERWTLLLVRELLTGPKRFKDLLAGLPGIGTNLLAARLKSLFEPEAGCSLERYEFRIEGETFHLRAEGGAVETRQGAADDPDVVVSGGVETFMALTAGRLGPEEALESGRIRIEGGDDAVARCLRMLGSAATTV
jgi:putative sterol carrier protein